MGARRLLRTFIALVGCLACAETAWSEDAALPQGAGLAAQYSGDDGIGRDPNVLFADNFETAKLNKWGDRDGNRPPAVRVVQTPAEVHAGRFAVQLTVPAGDRVQSDLTKWLPEPQTLVFARWYSRFADDYDHGDVHHTGGNLLGVSDPAFLLPSGFRPNGMDRFSTALETWRDRRRDQPPGQLHFYTSYPDMRPDRDGFYRGSAFMPPAKAVLERGRWYCLEMMVKLNTVGQSDGEQALWLDGRLVGRFQKIRWRTVDALKINCFWYVLYIHQNPKENRVWIDDVVIAKQYIGPMRAAASRGK